MGSEEERVLEEQLELQLQEQRDSLSAIDHAILSDPSNPELLAVPSYLLHSISLFFNISFGFLIALKIEKLLDSVISGHWQNFSLKL